MQPKMFVWTQEPIVRVFPFDKCPRNALKRIVLSAARDEFECAQIAFRWEEGILTTIHAQAGDLNGPRGTRISSENVELFLQEYVPVKWMAQWTAIHHERGEVEQIPPGFFPDPLVKTGEKGEVAIPVHYSGTRAFWVRIRIPRDARPGQYRGKITVTAVFGSDGKEAAISVEMCVEVWNFEVPSTPSLHMTNWFWPDQVADWYRQPMWSPGFWRLMEKFAEDMAAHRQDTILTRLFPFYFPIPGGPDEGLVRILRRGQHYEFDFSRFDRWCRLFFSKGFRLIEGSHLMDYHFKPFRPWVEASNGSRTRLSLGTGSRLEKFLRQFFAEFWKHLGRRGWQERYVQHIRDEPTGKEQQKQYERVAGIVRSAAPGIKLMDATADPVFGRLMDHPVPPESLYDELLKVSGRDPADVWTYYCCGPTGRWPNRFIEYPLIRLRILPWLCFSKSIPGILHWGFNYWGSAPDDIKRINPWDDTTANRWPGGDPCVVYPPRDIHMMEDGVIGSIRWEIIRKSLEDYEYLRMAQGLADGGNSRARTLLARAASRVIRDWTTHTRDWKVMKSLRQELGELLSESQARTGKIQ